MTRYLLGVRGLDKTSNAFRAKLVRESEARGLDPDAMAASMAFETMGTFSPSIRPLDKNGKPISGAVGLIQFMPATAKMLGTSSSALAAMSPEEQLDWVFKDFDRVLHGRHLDSLGDHYLTIFAPGAVGKPDDAVVYSLATTPDAYNANHGLDHDGDGTITVHEATAGVRYLYNEALHRPPVAVDMNAASSGGGSGLVAAAALVGLGVLIARKGTRT